MAGEKMEKKMDKGMCEGCCGMCKTCGSISGLLVLVAGACMLLSALGSLPGSTAGMVAGAALGLYGISLVVHSLGMCPMCK